MSPLCETSNLSHFSYLLFQFSSFETCEAMDFIAMKFNNKTFGSIYLLILKKRVVDCSLLLSRVIRLGRLGRNGPFQMAGRGNAICITRRWPLFVLVDPVERSTVQSDHVHHSITPQAMDFDVQAKHLHIIKFTI